MRGELPIKNDTEVTDADLKNHNLILFGDPGSNQWIAKTVEHLPLEWTKNHLRMANRQFTAKDHAPVLIHPNPLSPDRYIVVNSGHTFHEAEFAAFNYLLFPRLGDRAVMQILPGTRDWQPGRAFPEKPTDAGYLDESWK
jgi:hypothetical protein